MFAANNVSGREGRNQSSGPVPDTLWRGVSFVASQVTAELLRTELVPGTVDQKDPSKIGDGNEFGVYMSSNRTVAETCYARGSSKHRMPCPEFSYRLERASSIVLPEIGILFEVKTQGLAIRSPKITPSLMGHYNNGFAGDEFIADSIPVGQFRVQRFILSRWANDSAKFVVDVNLSGSDSDVDTALAQVQMEYYRREGLAQGFTEFLTGLTPRERFNSNTWPDVWQDYIAK
jgi:hypothetical protein